MSIRHKTCVDGDRIFIIRDFFSADECAGLIARSEQTGYEEAPINTVGGFVIAKDIRNNERLIADDRPLADTLWQRASEFMPPCVGEWSLVGLNERFRFYRYDPGQKFAPHLDGYFQRNDRERSQLTFMVYLNDDFVGGETKFYQEDGQPHVTVHPQRGMALVFAHLQLHEGAAIVQGRKYVLRTDVMGALQV